MKGNSSPWFGYPRILSFAQPAESERCSLLPCFEEMLLTQDSADDCGEFVYDSFAREQWLAPKLREPDKKEVV
jgi:hypothetical protein